VKSVGHSYAILRNRATGNKNKARRFLSSLSPAEKTMRNRNESRSRSKSKKYKLGERVKRK